jgi:hypothetical protein
MSTPITPGTDPWATTTAGTPGTESSGPDDMKSQAKQAAGTAADQAKQTAGTATDEGRHVAGVAKDEAQNVLQESRQQAQNLLDEARTQLDEQSRTQRDRLVGTLRTFGDDVEKMAGSEQVGGGLAQDLARQVAERARDLSGRIDGREPAELLDEVRSFARHRPGTFLLGAVAAGVVAGRLMRGAKEARSDDGRSASRTPLYDEVRGATAGVAGSGTAAGAPTAGTGYPDGTPAYPAGSAVDEPATTMDQPLSAMPGTPSADPVADDPWIDEPGGR